jgi:hypothetical protein
MFKGLRDSNYAPIFSDPLLKGVRTPESKYPDWLAGETEKAKR